VIKAELDREEARFLETLERGEKLLAEILEKESQSQSQQISGADAFELYDTYGFPLELTQEIAEEQGLTVDLAGFEAAMAATAPALEECPRNHRPDGAGQPRYPGGAYPFHRIFGIHRHQQRQSGGSPAGGGESVDQVEAGQDVQVVLNQTPFYAESGGQIGDRGYLSGDELVIRVTDVQKDGDFFVHFGKGGTGGITGG
jgi:alanyl-tRNA synthetase